MADDLAIFVSALSPTKKCRNRRLPGITQGDDFIRGSDSFTPGRRAANRWVIPGSRLFLHVSAGLVLRRNSPRAERYTPKRLPSRRWAIACRIDAPRHIEDDDENEDDYDGAAGSGSASVPALRMIEGIKAQVPLRKHSRHSGASPYQRTRKAVRISEPKSLCSTPPDQHRRRFRYPPTIGTAIFVCRIVETLAPKAQTAIV